MKRSCSSTEEMVFIKKPTLDKFKAQDQSTEDDDDDPISDLEDNGVDKVGSSTSTNFPVRLGKCEVCAAAEALYTCPKCEVKTCCLDCVRIHKKELDCDGIRDRTKFIPLKDMTKMDFMNDYYFLEECTRYVADRKGDRIKRYTRFNCELPLRLCRLRRAALDRKCTLKLLLDNFARHKENTTFYDWKLKKIFWRIKWIFVNAGSLCYVDERCSEDELLRDLLKKYMDKDYVHEVVVPEKRKLEYYQSKGVQGVKVLLKSEGIKRCRNRYYALDVNKTLKDNLKGKTLVEYPFIYISYEDQPCGVDIIDSDEDVEEDTKRHQANFEAYRKASLEKQRKTQTSSEDEEATAKDKETLEKLHTEKRRKERQLKREEYEKRQSNNFLFTDEQLMEALSSSTEDEDEQVVEASNAIGYMSGLTQGNPGRFENILAQALPTQQRGN